MKKLSTLFLFVLLVMASLFAGGSKEKSKPKPAPAPAKVEKPVSVVNFTHNDLKYKAETYYNKMTDLGAYYPNIRNVSGFTSYESKDNPTDNPSSDKGIQYMVDNEIKWAVSDTCDNDGDGTPDNKQPYVLVGHSQGGLNALAYSTRMKEQYPDYYKNLKGVITVSGADRGTKMLEGGLGSMISKLDTDVSILLGGVNGVLLGPTVPYYQKQLMKSLFGVDIGLTNAKILRETIAGYVIPSIPHSEELVGGYEYIRRALVNGNPNGCQEIKDMVPGCDFIVNNVATTKSATYKKQTGTKTVLEWRWVVKWLGIGYIWYRKKPVYTTYVATWDAPKFDSNLPVGYIMGGKNRTLSLLDKPGDTSGKEEQKVRNTLNKAADVFGIAKDVNYILAYVEVPPFVATPLVSLIGNKLTDVVRKNTMAWSRYKACQAAQNWCKNIDNELTDIIGGSKENDGFICKESMYYPKTAYNPATLKKEEVHSNVLGNYPLGYKVFNEYNHEEMDPRNDASVNRKVHEEIRYLLTELGL